jgi:hypothetical protein
MERKDAPAVELLAVPAILRHQHISPLPGELRSVANRGDAFLHAGRRYLPSRRSRALVISQWPSLAPAHRHQVIVIARCQYEQRGPWAVLPHPGKLASIIAHHSLGDESLVNIRDYYLVPVTTSSSDDPTFDGYFITAEHPNPLREKLSIRISGRVSISRNGEPLLTWRSPRNWVWSEYGITCSASQCHPRLVDIWHHVATHSRLPLPAWVTERFPILKLPAMIAHR